VTVESYLNQLIKDKRDVENKLEMAVTVNRDCSEFLFCMEGSKTWTGLKNLASLGDHRLKCSEEQLIEALTGRSHPMHRQMLVLELERLRLLDEQIAKLNSLIASAMKPHKDTVIRPAEVPGLGIDSAQQIIVEVGVTASAFSSTAEFTSWAGTCPGKEASG
jgi:transposase